MSEMNEAIVFRALWTIKPGKLDDVRREAQAFAEAVRRTQPGTRMVNTSISADGKFLAVHEVHKDPAATVAHLQGQAVPEFMPRFMAVADISGFEVYGRLTPEIEGLIKPFNPRVYPGVAGFLR